ncbi:flavoprotein [Elusimicrobiota bacterium]
MPKCVLGITGSIAAYKAAVIASSFKKKGLEVRTVFTDAACRFITPLTLKTVTEDLTYTGLWDNSDFDNHTHLSKWADFIIVAPATANTISKIANGIADNLLSTLILDFKGPVFIVPAMHENIWENFAVQRNVKILIDNGFYFIGPIQGDLAGGKQGIGRMVEPQEVTATALSILAEKYPAIN